MAVHRMTPARKAALRKAQIASARKRRKGGVRSAIKRNLRQSASYARASYNVRRRKVFRRKRK